MFNMTRRQDDEENSTSRPNTVESSQDGTGKGILYERRHCIIISVIMTATVLALAGLFGFNPSSGSGNPFVEENDGFKGTSIDDAVTWKKSFGSTKLSLGVLNALDTKWQSMFNISINEWDNGTPDVVTLVVSDFGVESECEPISGAMKVCNGYYGRTDWYGINVLVIGNGGYIAASTAMLNDDLLDKSSNARKQYTMCHEIGHGFGLPHTDEMFYNFNRGDCMDYTQFPDGNKQPGQVNFDRLNTLYGPPPPSSTTTTTTTTSSNSGGFNSGASNKDDKKDKDDKGNRNLRRMQSSPDGGEECDGTDENGGIPESVRVRYREVIDEMMNYAGTSDDTEYVSTHEDTTLVQAKKGSVSYSVKLDNCYNLEVNMLLLA